MSNALRIGVVLPAAGVGERIGSSIPKQFVYINGLPLLYHTIRAFSTLEHSLTKIAVVCNEQYEEFIEREVLAKLGETLRAKVICVRGGTTRHYSIASGVNAFESGPPDLIVIHDAVRPLIGKQILDDLIEAAANYGAAGPVCKLTSTVLSITDDGFLDSSLERSKFRASEMPQVFKYEIIKGAYDKCTKYDFEFGTECLHLAQKYSDAKVKFVEADASRLWKVTYKKDFIAASYCLADDNSQSASLLYKTYKHSLANPELLDTIEHNLKAHFESVSRINLNSLEQQPTPNEHPQALVVHFAALIDADETFEEILELSEAPGRDIATPFLRVHLICFDLPLGDKSLAFQVLAKVVSESCLFIILNTRDLEEPPKVVKLIKWINMFFSFRALSDLSGQILFL